MARLDLGAYSRFLKRIHRFLFLLRLLGRLACNLYETMKREAAAVKIQTTSRRHLARMAYIRIKSSVLVLQTGLRAMAARNEFRCRKQTKASIIIQVID